MQTSNKCTQEVEADRLLAQAGFADDGRLISDPHQRRFDVRVSNSVLWGGGDYTDNLPSNAPELNLDIRYDEWSVWEGEI